MTQVPQTLLLFAMFNIHRITLRMWVPITCTDTVTIYSNSY